MRTSPKLITSTDAVEDDDATEAGSGDRARSGEGERNPAVDAYIARAAPFARPILSHLRHVVHAACPTVVEEMKWSMPFFVYGSNLCHMAAFKAHCAFGFWRAKEIPELGRLSEGDGKGTFGRVLSVDDLPQKRRLTSLIKAAMKLNDAGRPGVRGERAPKPSVAMPDDVAAALSAHPAAANAFAAFASGAQRDYLEWIVEAKRAETRASRIATLVAQSAEGKTRHWKYQR